jgi:hypothetical protein
LYALLSGDRQLFARAADLSRPLLHEYIGVDDKSLGTPSVLRDLVGLLVVAHLDGDEQQVFWQKIATAKPFKSPLMRCLQVVIGKLVGKQPKRKKTFKPELGPVKSESQWLHLLEKAPTRYLFDQAISPDHPLWSYTLDTFVLPLGLLLANELCESGDAVDPFELFRQGAYPERRGSVVYERRYPRPVFNSEPDPEVPATWSGFDAVEFRDEQVLVYHYLGLKWQAPLLFEDGLNAFRFLDQLDLGWHLVQMALSGEQWKEVEKRKNAGQCIHIVVHDESEAPCIPGHLERAATHYGVVLEARDLTLV